MELFGGVDKPAGGGRFEPGIIDDELEAADFVAELVGAWPLEGLSGPDERVTAGCDIGGGVVVPVTGGVVCAELGGGFAVDGCGLEAGAICSSRENKDIAKSQGASLEPA